jgi:hypothetical protein
MMDRLEGMIGEHVLKTAEAIPEPGTAGWIEPRPTGAGTEEGAGALGVDRQDDSGQGRPRVGHACSHTAATMIRMVKFPQFNHQKKCKSVNKILTFRQ